MPDLDFTKLSPEQEKILHEILGICRYLAVTRTWKPPISDGVLAEQARQIGWKMEQLKRVSQ